MSEQQTSETDQTTETTTTNVSEETTTTSNTDSVSRDDHERALKDMHKYKAQTQELEEKLKQQALDKMKSNEEWQKIAEMKEREAQEATEKATTLQESLVFNKKYEAVKSLALSRGLRQEAVADLDLIGFEDVQIETTSTGRINVLGADKAVDRLKALRPHWFGSRASNVNSDTPEVVAGEKVTYDQIYKAEKKAKESGDYAPYKALLRQYQNQTQ